jgi:hypothetical protein
MTALIVGEEMSYNMRQACMRWNMFLPLPPSTLEIKRLGFLFLMRWLPQKTTPPVPGIQANGVIKLVPDTITSEALKLLEDAFRRQELLMGEDQAVHLLHICMQLKLEQLFVCKDEQPEAFVTDNNFLALAACLLDHGRSRGNLLQFCLHRLHGVGPKLAARCPR